MRINVSEHLGSITSLAPASTQGAAGLRKLARQKFPFLEYAVVQVLQHADMTEENGISQRNCMENFALDT